MKVVRPNLAFRGLSLVIFLVVIKSDIVANNGSTGTLLIVCTKHSTLHYCCNEKSQAFCCKKHTNWTNQFCQCYPISRVTLTWGVNVYQHEHNMLSMNRLSSLDVYGCSAVFLHRILHIIDLP